MLRSEGSRSRIAFDVGASSVAAAWRRDWVKTRVMNADNNDDDDSEEERMREATVRIHWVESESVAGDQGVGVGRLRDSRGSPVGEGWGGERKDAGGKGRENRTAT